MPRLFPATFDDPQLDCYRDLPRKNLTSLSGRFVVEGKWLVERLAASDYAIQSVVVDERHLNLLPELLPEQTPVYVLAHCDIERLIGFNFHRGILACGLRKPSLTSTEVVPAAGPATLVACVDIHDPTNLGGILRNCAAFGVDGVLLSPNCADPFSRRVLRVSMGTAFKLRLAHLDDSPTGLKRLRAESGFELLAAVLADDAGRLETAGRSDRIVLLIGNEGHGLPQSCIEACDRRITLPMSAGIDSLNAAAATAVFLYHFTRIASNVPPARAASAS